jgi:hypothetical protein
MPPTELAHVTSRADYLIRLYSVPIKAILANITAEQPYVGALFDSSDDEGIAIYRELGFTAEASRDSVHVLDVLQAPLEAALRRHNYVPIDERGSYEAGTVLLFVFTGGAVVGRRFEAPAGKALREVKRNRDVQFVFRGHLDHAAAIQVILERAAPVLQQLWDRGTERVALIESVSHGATVGYISRETAIEGLREAATRLPPDHVKACRGMADALGDGSRPGQVPCIIQGWGALELSWLDARSLGTPATRYFDDDAEAVLHEYIAACRIQKRALGLLGKCVDGLGDSPPSAPVRELVTLLRDAWGDHDAILAKILALHDMAASIFATDAGKRLRVTLLALEQATMERQRGGAVNARGGRA